MREFEVATSLGKVWKFWTKNLYEFCEIVFLILVHLSEKPCYICIFVVHFPVHRLSFF